MPDTRHTTDRRAGREGAGLPGSDCKLTRRAARYGLALTRERGLWTLRKPGGQAPFQSHRAEDVHRVLDAVRDAARAPHAQPERHRPRGRFRVQGRGSGQRSRAVA